MNSYIGAEIIEVLLDLFVLKNVLESFHEGAALPANSIPLFWFPVLHNLSCPSIPKYKTVYNVDVTSRNLQLLSISVTLFEKDVNIISIFPLYVVLPLGFWIRSILLS